MTGPSCLLNLKPCLEEHSMDRWTDDLSQELIQDPDTGGDSSGALQRRSDEHPAHATLRPRLFVRRDAVTHDGSYGPGTFVWFRRISDGTWRHRRGRRDGTLQSPTSHSRSTISDRPSLKTEAPTLFLRSLLTDPRCPYPKSRLRSCRPDQGAIKTDHADGGLPCTALACSPRPRSQSPRTTR